MGVQGAKPPAGARGVPALSPFPKRLGDDALAITKSRMNLLEIRNPKVQTFIVLRVIKTCKKASK
jgi:hypothetical protein